jgi:hypothetical protein
MEKLTYEPRCVDHGGAAACDQTVHDQPEKVGASHTLFIEHDGARFAASFAEEHHPSPMPSGQDVREFEVGAVKPLEVGGTLRS